MENQNCDMCTMPNCISRKMAVSEGKPLIWHIASCCKFVKLKDELFEQCSLKEIMD